MSGNSAAHCGLDKRKACVFLILVAVGIACICMLAYMLFYAAPHANPAIKDAPGHSMILPDAPPSRTIAGKCVVRS
jgi:hypothetical protein